MKHRIIPRILLSILGAAMILWGLSTIVLGFAGERAVASVTSVRRVGGERNETVPNRYTYSIGYDFSLPDGRKISGSTQKIGGAVYTKADGKLSVMVRYYAFFPYISALESETGFKTGSMVVAAAGGLLIFLINRSGAGKKRSAKKRA